MYGVPADLNLDEMTGATLIQLAIGEFQIQFRFMPYWEIGVEGHWEVSDFSGSIIDQARPNANRDAYRIHHLLGHQVVGAQIHAPESITLEFDNGCRLRLFDSSREFECFTIHPGGIIV